MTRNEIVTKIVNLLEENGYADHNGNACYSKSCKNLRSYVTWSFKTDCIECFENERSEGYWKTEYPFTLESITKIKKALTFLR